MIDATRLPSGPIGRKCSAARPSGPPPAACAPRPPRPCATPEPWTASASIVVKTARRREEKSRDRFSAFIGILLMGGSRDPRVGQVEILLPGHPVSAHLSRANDCLAIVHDGAGEPLRESRGLSPPLPDTVT